MTVWIEPSTDDWRTHARCKGQPVEWFYPEPNTNIGARARAICATCPVQQPCLNWAVIHENYGIHAGTSPRQRERLRPQAAGYQWRCPLCNHWQTATKRPGERTYCDECAAHRTWLRRTHGKPSPDATAMHTQR